MPSNAHAIENGCVVLSCTSHVARKRKLQNGPEQRNGQVRRHQGLFGLASGAVEARYIDMSSGQVGLIPSDLGVGLAQLQLDVSGSL